MSLSLRTMGLRLPADPRRWPDLLVAPPFPPTPTGAVARRARATALGLLRSRTAAPVHDTEHPVARFGAIMTAIERVLWRDHRLAGTAYTTIGVAIGATAGALTRSTSVVVSICAAGAQLRSVAGDVADALDRVADAQNPDARARALDDARALLPSLCGRDPSMLDASGLAAAATESVAENMVDAVFAPALAALLGGAPGAAAHRAANTMDAMVGHHDDRYERFGWASARLDDVAAYAPARIFAVAVAAVRPDRAQQVTLAVARDAGAHPSPNAGVAEAAMAGALGRELGGPLRYGDSIEHRPTLGRGPRPDVDDLRAAIAVADDAERLLIAVTAVAGTAAAFVPGVGW